MASLILRDYHTHPHRWDHGTGFGWNNFFGGLLIAVAWLLSVYWALFYR